MDRRQALKTLIALPAVKNIEVARIAPDDVIVVTSDHSVSERDVEYITDAVRRVWPSRRVLVVDKGLSIQVIRSTDAPRA